MVLLTSVLTIYAGFLSGWYVDKLFMACGYDAEQLLPLIFSIVAGEKSVAMVGSCSGYVKKLSVLVKLLLSQINI
jgi:hypothetical protein